MYSQVTTKNPSSINLMAKADRLFEKDQINEKGYCTLRALATSFLGSAEQLAGISHGGLISTFDRLSKKFAELDRPEFITHVEPVTLSAFGFAKLGSPSVVATNDPEVFLSWDYMSNASLIYDQVDTCRAGDFLAQLRTMRGMYILWKAQQMRKVAKSRGLKYVKPFVENDDQYVAYAINDLVDSVGL